MDLSELPPVNEPLKRLRIYQAARSAEEERVLVEALMEKRREELTTQEWRILNYSPWGFGSRCGY